MKLLIAAAACASTLGFSPCSPALRTVRSLSTYKQPHTLSTLRISSLGAAEIKEEVSSSPEDSSDVETVEAIVLSAEEEKELGNLVANEEWSGLSMELTEVIATAVVEDLKKNSRDFLGKDDYSVGDFSKEIDQRVKDEVAKMREKDDYELGDLSVVLDDKVKELVCELSGKDEYEFGDLSIEIDKKVKESVASFCGKDKYEFGDLSKEVAKRTSQGVLNYTGKSDYKFGDISKTFAKNITGKDDYEFGDVTKKIMGNLFKKNLK